MKLSKRKKKIKKRGKEKEREKKGSKQTNRRSLPIEPLARCAVARCRRAQM